MKVSQSCPTLCDPHGIYRPWNSPDQNTGVGSHSLLQGIFPTQGLNPGLCHCRWVLYQPGKSIICRLVPKNQPRRRMLSGDYCLYLLCVSTAQLNQFFLLSFCDTSRIPENELTQYGGAVVKNPPAYAGDSGNLGSAFGLRRPPGVGNGTLLQYSCLENSMDRGVWQVTVHRVTKNRTQLNTQACTAYIKMYYL